VQGMKAHPENSREVGAWHSSPPEGRGILPTSRSIREAKSNAKTPSSIHGMRELFANRRIPIHENSRTTVLEIFALWRKLDSRMSRMRMFALRT